jgi:hypothetical protein
MSMKARLTWAIVALMGTGCAAEGGTGTLSVRVSGEEAARSGYPVGEGDGQIAFRDGWTLAFHKILVSLSKFSLGTTRGDKADDDADPVVVDLHRGETELWRLDGLVAQRWNQVGYRYTPPSAATRVLGDVADADLRRMRDEGYSFLIEATVRKDDRQVELSWGFPLQIAMAHCQNGLDETDGIVVRDNAVTNGEITVHLDHLFLDDWAVAEPNLRFDAMAAMAPSDRALTLDDLKKQDNLSDLKRSDGVPLDLSYDPGSAFHPVPDNLAQYTEAAAETTGHWNGEGHCEYHRL